MNCNPCGQPIEGEARVTVTFDGPSTIRGITVVAHARCIRFVPTPAPADEQPWAESDRLCSAPDCERPPHLDGAHRGPTWPKRVPLMRATR